MSDAELAAELAIEAGKLLLDVRDTQILEGKALGDAGDATANQFLCHTLRAARPDDGLLSEEEKDDESLMLKPLSPSAKEIPLALLGAFSVVEVLEEATASATPSKKPSIRALLRR